MWQNPINFLFFIGILFWLPQLEVQKEELEQDHSVLNFITGQGLIQGATAAAISPGPLKITAVATAVADDPCLYSILQVATDSESLKKEEFLFSQPRLPDQLNLQTPSGPLLVSTEGINVITHPNPGFLKITPFVPPVSAAAWEKTWAVKDAASVAMIEKAGKEHAAQVQCLAYGQKVLVTGYLTAENHMAFTVSTPFTLAFADEGAVVESLYSQISKTYLGCAFIVLMMATLGLAILTNSILRGRINLPFESVDLSKLPWSHAREKEEANEDYWIRRLGLKARNVQMSGLAQLPSFYRYHWEDGLTLRGRHTFFVVHDEGITLLELSQSGQPRACAEVAWGDLFCIYFTQWNAKQTWFDLVTRTGDRYQMAVLDARQLRTLVKRWDATQVLDQQQDVS